MMSETSVPGARTEWGGWILRLVFLALSIGVVIAALDYGLRDDKGLVGPGMMPFFAGVVMGGATLWEAIIEIRHQRLPAVATPSTNAIADADEVDAAARPPGQQRKAVLTVFLVVLATVLLTRLTGLLIALSLMVFMLIWPVERKPWWAALTGAVSAFGFGWVVFGIILDVPLPTGLLGLV